MFFKKKCSKCGAKNLKERMTCIDCGLPLTSGQVKGQLTEVLQESKLAPDAKLEAPPERVAYVPNRIGKIDLSRGSLGIETLGGFTPVVKRGSQRPLTHRIIFSTAVDSQEIIEVRFAFGDTPMNVGNKSLGRLLLSGIKPAPKGVPQIEVTVDIDRHGEVSLSAVDKHTAQSIECEIYSSGCENVWL